MHPTGCLACLASCLIPAVYASSLRFGRAVPAGATSTPTLAQPLPIPSQPPIPVPSPSAVAFYFTNLPQFTTCEPATLDWNYTGPSSQQLYMSIISAQISPSSALDRVSGSSSLINHPINVDIDPVLETWTWPSVNVPQGSYRLFADIPAQNLNTTSSEFQVRTGTNSSCLPHSSSDLSTNSTSHVGAIVGGVLGGAGFILVAVVAYLLYRRKRLDKTKPRTIPAGGTYSDDRKRNNRSLFVSATRSWDNLGSVDSHAASGAPSKRLHYQQHHYSAHTSFADSVNLPVLDYSRNGSRRSLNGEDEKGSPTDSVLSKSPIEGVLDRASYFDAQRRRKPSEASSLAASTVLSHMAGSSPITPVPPLPLLNRSQIELSSPTETPDLNLAPKSSKPRKRKPVPAYDPTPYPTPSPPQSATVESDPLQADDPFARPLPAVVHKTSSSSLDALARFNHAGGSGHYVSRPPSHSGKERELTHKHSFGFEGRPMHYLMPDMPLPQKK